MKSNLLPKNSGQIRIKLLFSILMLPAKTSSHGQKGFAQILILLPIALLILGTTANIKTTQTFPNQDAIVLGDEDENKQEENKKEEESKKEESKKAEEQQKEEQKKAVEAQKQSSKTGSSQKSGSSITKTKTESESQGTKIKTETEGDKQETEIETADGQKIKTKIEDDGTTKVELEHGPLKLKYVFENGRLTLKAENESGEEVELDDDEETEVEDEIENELEEDGIKIATDSGKPLITKNNIGALTDFPLSIDVGTNQLIVTTPQGQKIVTVLPDEAVQNLLATNIINKIESLQDDQGNQLETLGGTIKLEIRNDEIVYRVKGTKTHKLAGFIPISTDATAFVSAQTGNLVAKEQSVLAGFIDRISL